MKTKEEILARQKEYKAANKEKQNIYAKRCYEKSKGRNAEMEENKIKSILRVYLKIMKRRNDR